MNRILAEAVEQFSSSFPQSVVVPIAQGNINDTFLVAASTGKFILQRISAAVFPNPLRVITNFRKVSEHLQRQTPEIAPEWQFARPVYTDKGDLFYQDERGGFWRGQTYLPHAGLAMTGDSDQAYELGQALGLFHLLMSDMNLEELHDPLPGFHFLPHYLEQFDFAWQKKKLVGRKIDHCFAVIAQYRKYSSLLERLKAEGILTEQPVHGDPKTDNFIFNEAGYGVGLIDMDTVGPGLIHSDIGDCLRSCCNRIGEGGKNERQVTFDMGICRAILKGYFQKAETLLSPLQRCYIFDSLMVITFELGLRFFTDHLLGDRYFKILAPGDNLQRAMTQFRLVEEIQKFELDIRRASEA